MSHDDFRPWFDTDAADELAEEMFNNHGDLTHPPGPIRSKRVRECVTNANKSAGSGQTAVPSRENTVSSPPMTGALSKYMQGALERAERALAACQESEQAARDDKQKWEDQIEELGSRITRERLVRLKGYIRDAEVIIARERDCAKTQAEEIRSIRAKAK